MVCASPIVAQAPPLRIQLREYFHQSKHLHLTFANKRLLSQMSPMLQGEVAWRIHQRWLRRVAFLRRAEHDFIIQVALLASHLTLADVTLPATLSSARPDLTRPCLPSQVALLLSPMVFAPGELAASGWLYIVHRGIALYGGKVLTAGKVWNPTLALRTSLGRRAHQPSSLANSLVATWHTGLGRGRHPNKHVVAA